MAEDIWKVGAERFANYFGDVRRQLSSEFAAEVRWITASLFALNAGGMLHVAGDDKIEKLQRLAGISFWLGILLAFGFVIYSQHKTKQFLYIIQKIEECWVITAATGVPGGEQLKQLELQKQQLKTGLSKLFSIGSFLMWSIGIGLLAWPE